MILRGGRTIANLLFGTKQDSANMDLSNDSVGSKDGKKEKEARCKMGATASLWEERNSVTAAGEDVGVRSSHQHT